MLCSLHARPLYIPTAQSLSLPPFISSSSSPVPLSIANPCVLSHTVSTTYNCQSLCAVPHCQHNLQLPIPVCCPTLSAQLTTANPCVLSHSQHNLQLPIPVCCPTLSAQLTICVSPRGTHTFSLALCKSTCAAQTVRQEQVL